MIELTNKEKEFIELALDEKWQFGWVSLETKTLKKLYKCYIIISRNEGRKMKYEVRNLRNGKVAIYEELERAERFIRISVMFNNQDKTSSEKRWTKNDFKIVEVK